MHTYYYLFFVEEDINPLQKEINSIYSLIVYLQYGHSMTALNEN